MPKGVKAGRLKGGMVGGKPLDWGGGTKEGGTLKESTKSSSSTGGKHNSPGKVKKTENNNRWNGNGREVYRKTQGSSVAYCSQKGGGTFNQNKDGKGGSKTTDVLKGKD